MSFKFYQTVDIHSKTKKYVQEKYGSLDEYGSSLAKI